MKQLFTAAEIAAVTGGRVQGDPSTPVTGFAWDSRKVQPGDCFVAMPGERVDGHDFVAKAVAAGAAVALVGRPVAGAPVQVQVRDPLIALGQLGRARRERFSLPIVGVTGSVGKTTTKELIAAALSAGRKVFKSTGNLNSEVGLPVTLMGLDESHEVAVLEMGMRALGEIAYLASIAKHNIGVVTNVGTSHLELLGSQENIGRAKGELIEHMPEDGVAVLNWDDERVRLMDRLAKGKVWFYGFDVPAGPNFVTARDIQRDGEVGQRFTLVTADGEQEVYLPTPGRHNVLNAMAAACVGLEVGLTLQQIADGLRSYEPAGNRMRVLNVQGVRVIDDTYNAAPNSTVAALQVMRDLAGDGRCVAVLGSMFELGSAAPEAHRQVGAEAARLAESIIAVGDLAADIARGAEEAGARKVSHFLDKDAAFGMLASELRPGDTVLVKGSRGMAMEEIVQRIENNLPRFG